MKIDKTKGIIIRWYELGDTSKIIKLYTKDFGKMKVVAKGVKNLKSKFGSAMDLFNLSEIVFYNKESRDLQLLSEADLIEQFESIQNNYYKYQIVSCIAQILDNFTLPEEKNLSLYKMTAKALHLTSEADDSNMIMLSYLYAVKLIAMSGYKPLLRECAVCSRENFDEDDFYLSISEGGIVCKQCRAKKENLIKITTPVVSLLQNLIRKKMEHYNQFSLSPYQKRILVKYIKETVEEFTGSKINSCLTIWRRSNNG